jgi:hypothetical protein
MIPVTHDGWMAARLAGAALVAIVVGLVAGCAATGGAEPPDPYLTAAIGAGGPGTAPGPGIFPLVPATHAHVQLQCPLVSAVHYDPDAIPLDSVDGVYACTTRPWDDAYDGTPQIEEFVDRVAGDDVAGLLEAYAAADAERTDGACDKILKDPLIVWIHYGDEQITPVYAPMDECGFPQPDAAAAYESLELHRLLVAREKTTP